MKNKFFLVVFLFIICMESFAQLSQDSIQLIFPAGNIVSLKDNIACYRLKGIKDGGMYGFCKYDNTYNPDITLSYTSWNADKGEVSNVLNSRCYTIIAPIYDYALPFNDGWAPVCINKKWTYVSLDRIYMCDFILDAAYPFKNGKAKVIYEGVPYEINCKGEGLPNVINKKTEDLSIDLNANTIIQLYSESQCEKAIDEGKRVYDKITTVQSGSLPELSKGNLKNAIIIAAGIMSAQNRVMSQLCSHPKFQDIFDKYRTIPIDRFVSFESRHPAINRYNAESYFSSFKEKYGKKCADIITEIDRKDYKSAIVKFEKWAKENKVSLTDDFLLLMAYYYLAELSDDFETANKLLIKISSNYENSNVPSSVNDEALFVILANIKKYRSAESMFYNQIEKSKDSKSDRNLFSLYYNLGLMYKSAKDEKKSIDCLKKALQYKLSEDMEDSRLECLSDLINLQLKTKNIDYNLLKEYVISEIDFSSNIFETENTIISNRLWGNSIQRMQRILCYLTSCTDNTYLKAAFVLALFQQAITLDSEKLISGIISNLGDTEIQGRYNKFLERKSNFRGVDVFDLISAEDSVRKDIYELYDLETSIKKDIKKSKGHYIPTDIYKKSDTNNLNLVDIIKYQDSNYLYRFGAFVKAKNGPISFIPLGIYDEFPRDEFWDLIDLKNHFNPQEDIYVYYNTLDTLGLEYKKIDTRIPFCDYRLHRLSSLTNLMSAKNLFPNKKIVLYGGLDYGDNFFAKNRGASKGYLENSILEIKEIGNIFGNSDDVDIKTEDKGTIESFQQLSGKSPRILHLATHGYSAPRPHIYSFLEDRFNYYRQNTDIQQREWLMNNTGLLMSLDNNDLNVLYANKVASDDLSNTELVVLSACNTISGNTSDGNMQSIGLTTAFSLASAKNIITSLREVDDKKTYEFMVCFYKFLKESNNIYDSFRNTVLEMKQRYPHDPDYWNSFVLVEN